MQPGGCMSTDRIEKQILLRAPRARVWRALSDSSEFGTWFGMKFDGPFAPGAVVRAVIVGFTLEETPQGILLTVTESGFDRIPLARRSKAFTANDEGWGVVMRLVEE